MEGLSLSRLGTSEDPSHVLAHVGASAACLPITVLPIPGDAERRNDAHANARIFVAHQGRGHRWYQQGGRTVPLRTEPRMIEIYEKGLVFDHCKWKGDAGRCVLIEFPDHDVQALTHGELQSLALRTHQELFDDRISGLALDIAQEVVQGQPSGRLYTQGLCLALVGLLASHYTVDKKNLSPPLTSTLGRAQQKRIIELIHHELADHLSVARLAGEVDLSPQHFTRVFKATFGVTPHRYVKQRRIEAAAESLLREPRRPIAEIALAHGFASQSHMTDAMRRDLGTTPRMLRRSGS